MEKNTPVYYSVLPFGFSLGVGFGVACIGSTGRAGAVPIGCGATVRGSAFGAGAAGAGAGAVFSGDGATAGAGALGSDAFLASGVCAYIAALITRADADKMIFFMDICFYDLVN